MCLHVNKNRRYPASRVNYNTIESVAHSRITLHACTSQLYRRDHLTINKIKRRCKDDGLRLSPAALRHHGKAITRSDISATKQRCAHLLYAMLLVKINTHMLRLRCTKGFPKRCHER